MYERLGMGGYHSPSPFIGYIFDVASTLEDLTILFEIGATDSDTYAMLNKTFSEMMKKKNRYNMERNTWQEWQTGGDGEPYHYNRQGLRRAHAEMISLKTNVFCALLQFRPL